jgi:hypothetical protein
MWLPCVSGELWYQKRADGFTYDSHTHTRTRGGWVTDGLVGWLGCLGILTDIVI